MFLQIKAWSFILLLMLLASFATEATVGSGSSPPILAYLTSGAELFPAELSSSGVMVYSGALGTRINGNSNSYSYGFIEGEGHFYFDQTEVSASECVGPCWAVEPLNIGSSVEPWSYGHEPALGDSAAFAQADLTHNVLFVQTSTNTQPLTLNSGETISGTFRAYAQAYLWRTIQFVGYQPGEWGVLKFKSGYTYADSFPNFEFLNSSQVSVIAGLGALAGSQYDSSACGREIFPTDSGCSLDIQIPLDAGPITLFAYLWLESNSIPSPNCQSQMDPEKTCGLSWGNQGDNWASVFTRAEVEIDIPSYVSYIPASIPEISMRTYLIFSLLIMRSILHIKKHQPILHYFEM